MTLNDVKSDTSEVPSSEPKMSRFDLPGLSLPLDFVPEKARTKYDFVQGKSVQNQIPARGEGANLFKNALESDSHSAECPMITLRELTMLQLMNQLTDKPNWHEKVFDDEITMKWKDETLALKNADITQSMVDWCIGELRYKAPLFEKSGAVSVYPGDVVKSDVAIPSSLKQALQSGVLILEDIPEKLKDWHPGSEGRVLDLVHPSMFPLVYGRTRVLPNRLVTLNDPIGSCGEGIVIPFPKATGKPYSQVFQWLPCDVDISSAKGVKITSYINNLHPQKHVRLYTTIEEIIDRAIPLWNMTLSPLHESSTSPWNNRRIKYEICEEKEEATPADGEGPEREPWEDDEHYEERQQEWARVIKPEPGIFFPPEQVDQLVDLKRDYKHRGLQVIVKLANIHLTPDKPSYEGGTWHVEGQLNEHICASALYYYDSENVTNSRLAFRQQSCESDASDVSYEQDHHEWLGVVFGCKQDGPAVQVLGDVTTPEGRLLTFPNILQHQVQPFELADKNIPGHRNILALFLVDPGIRITSTANVPPQRRDWWRDKINGERWNKLPVELRSQVCEYVDDWPLSLEEAKKLRVDLMAERKHFAVIANTAFEHLTFSLCEH